MKKKIIAFYDLLLYLLICGPMIITAITILFILLTKVGDEGIYEKWHLVVAFAILFMVPIGCTMLFRYFVVSNDSAHFHYFPFWEKWETAANNIDVKWNQDVFISEIKSVEVVKLTEEQQSKVYYKHWFNKYLKINLSYGKSKYVYIGNYSNCQIKKIINLLTNTEKNG